MEKYLFMNTLLQLINRPSFFKQVCGYVLRSLAVVTFFAGITGFVQIWKFTEPLPVGQMFGAVIFLLIFVVAVYMVVHILWIRSANFFDMPEAEFVFSHACELFLRTIGEIYAAFSVPISIGGGILIWFTGGRAQEILVKVAPFLKRYGDYSFPGGLLQIIGGTLYSFFVLVLFYLLAELLVMAIDATMNIRYTRNIAEQYDRKGK